MKKLILLLGIVIFMFVFIFYNKGDNSTPQDSLIGTWKYYKLYENDIEYELDHCEKQDTFIFLENGSFTESYYYANDSGNCIIDGRNSGSWSNKKNNVYIMDYDGEEFEITLERNTFYINYVDDIQKKEIYIKQ